MSIFDSDLNFDSFDPTTAQEWSDKIVKDLKGKSYEETLIISNLEDIRILPDYHQDNFKASPSEIGKANYRRGWKTNNHWNIRSPLFKNTNKEANIEAIHELKGGAAQVGIQNIENIDFNQLFEDIQIDVIGIDFSELSSEQSKKLQQYFKDCQYNNESIEGWINNEVDFDDPKAILNPIQDWKAYSRFKPLSIDLTSYANNGALLQHQLGIALAKGNAIINSVNEQLTIDDIAGAMVFHFSNGTNLFFEIAKLRAFKVLWSHLVQQYQPEHQCSSIANIHSETSQWNLSQKDTYTNLLRNTVSATASIIGGSDAITISSYDINQPETEFSKRMSRNIALLLREESFLSTVADPAGGAYYIEYLTDQFIEKGWAFFQEIEAKGGYCKAQNFIEETISVDRKKLIESFKNGKTLVGINQYQPEKSTGKIEQETIAAELEK